MKARLGFVSNSSTSSFCIFGVQYDSMSAAIKALGIEGEPGQVDGCDHEFDRIAMKFCPECGEAAYVTEDKEEWQERQIESILEKYGLDIVDKTYVDYGCYIGWQPCGDGKALIKGMTATNKAILELFGEEASLYQGAYYS